MSTKFYFKDLSINNFRAFDSLSIGRFRRINIIGGFNGVGKTAFLEVLFFALDHRSPVGLIKPVQWRKYETSSGLDPSQFLRDSTNPDASVAFTHRTGRTRIALKHELAPRNVSISIASAGQGAGIGTTDTNQKGISVRTFDTNAQQTEETFLMPTSNGAVGNVSLVSDIHIPNAQFISIATRGPIAEVATRFSNIIRQRRLQDLINPLRELVPNLTNIQALQDGNISQIFVNIDGEFTNSVSRRRFSESFSNTCGLDERSGRRSLLG